MTLFERALIAHMVADWFLQNRWMSDNKTSLAHPASWVHSGIHLACLLLVFPAWLAVLVAVTHLLIDTRKPLIWWRKVYGQSAPDAVFPAFAMWQDQAAHILVLGVAVWLGGVIAW